MIHWQDFVFSIGSVFFIIAMVGSILSPTQKPPRASCIMTAFWLWAYMIVYISYGLWLSTFTGALSATGWTILSIQRRKHG